MPVPQLLKKLSRGNLRKRTKSFDSSMISADGRDSPPPPLPPKFSTNRGSTVTLPLPVNVISQGTPSEILKGLGNHNSTNGIPFPRPISSPPNGHIATVEDEFAATWETVNKKGQVMTKADAALGKIEGKVAQVRTMQANHAIVTGGIIGVVEAAGGLEAIEQGVNHFMEGSAVLMNALDEVAKLHPFISVAVLAFKAVWTLEMKRRENEKKIIALYVEMRDMMEVLIQLKAVQKDPTDMGPDGTPIKDRVGTLAKKTADDIKDCSNTCDTYSKKKLVAKVLNGPLWDQKLLTFVNLFTKRRGEFEFALSIYTARGINEANQTLNDVNKMTQALDAKMDAMKAMFEKFVLPEQKEMARMIEQKGGSKACQTDDKLLKELSELEQKSGSGSGSSIGAAGGSEMRNALDDLKADLRTDIGDAIEKNMKSFERKFDLQTRHITQEVERAVKREGDRIIGAISSGPHDKILDPDVHDMWKEMGWRGSVKARHFVMCLRDSFHEKWTYEGLERNGTDGIPPTIKEMRKPDGWALAYLNILRLQPITEAFDDDASGFITVAETNTFTSSRPIEWSLPHWIAYWAVGWHQTLTIYAAKIGDIIGKMFAMLPSVKHENQNAVANYLLKIYEPVMSLQEAVNPCYLNESLRRRFQSYMDSEEERLKGNLEAVHYDIDDAHTLTVVTGPGRIEKYILPLLYLILQRHFEIFKVSRKQILHRDELWDAADTLKWVFEAMQIRRNDLESIFTQQKLDVQQQFKTFAHGLWAYVHDPSGLWGPEVVRQSDPPSYEYIDDPEENVVKAEDVCAYELDQEGLDMGHDEIPSPSELEAEDASLKAILGRWNGYIYDGEYTNSGMISFTLLPEKNTSNNFRATGRSNTSTFEILGTCNPGEKPGTVDVSFKRTFPARFGPQYWKGQFDAARDTITGTVIMYEDEDHEKSDSTFILKRTPPEQLRFRPPPIIIERHKARTMWRFAIDATRASVRKRLWTWSYFRERRDNRTRFLSLYLSREKMWGELSDEETTEFEQLLQTLTSTDDRFYHSLALHKIRMTTQHRRSCDVCSGHITGARLICLTCLHHQTGDRWNSVDVCDATECRDGRVERSDLTTPHLPSHDWIKVRRFVHLRDVGELERTAIRALKNARKTLGMTPNKRGGGNDLLGESTLQNGGGPACLFCKSPVKQPCWYCIQCDDDIFVCDACDKKGISAFDKYKGAHDYNTHDLVICHDPVKEVGKLTVDERLANLEGLFVTRDKVMEDKLSKVDGRLSVVDDRLAGLESKVDGRMSRLEKLLEVMLDKMGGAMGYAV